MAEKKMDGSDDDEGQRRPVSTRESENELSSEEKEKRCTCTLAPLRSTNTITIFEKGSPSRKGNSNHGDEEGETHVETKKPRTLTLFGVEIPIPEAGKGTVAVSESSSRNPNQQEEGETQVKTKKPRIRKSMLFEINIPSIPEVTMTADESPSRNPNSQEEEEEALAALIPQPQFHPSIFLGSQYHPVQLFEKVLHRSDIDPLQNRLLVTGSSVLMAALQEEERERVGVNKKDFLRVMTTDQNGGVYTLHLTKWPTSGATVLIREWKVFVRANQLEIGDSVQGWGYRVAGGEFRLALSIVRKGN